MKPSILIVEDEDLIRDLVRMLFEQEAYSIQEAGDLATLRLKLVSSPAPDVVLLDLSLPDGDGLSVLPEIQGTWPKSKIVIMTGHNPSKLSALADHSKGVFFQSKPFQIATLKKTVAAALRGPAEYVHANPQDTRPFPKLG